MSVYFLGRRCEGVYCCNLSLYASLRIAVTMDDCRGMGVGQMGVFVGREDDGVWVLCRVELWRVF